jgi:EAL domain-containing protein (putative c-di-GMP-specific phosphodiesterase class I)/DNA-binding response OmpR family regulator
MSDSRVLVVDDDPAVRELVRTTLELEGYDVVAVADGPQALDHLQREPVDAVVLDRTMPGVDGLEVLAVIRADPVTSLIPVLLLTAVDGPAATVEGLDGGADDYITKPFVPEELAARVRAQLRGQRAWTERVTASVAHRRAVLATAAATAGSAATAAAAAEALCTVLVSEPGVDGVAIVAVDGPLQAVATVGVDGLDLLHLAGDDERLRDIHRGLHDGPVRATMPDRVVIAAPVRQGAGTLAAVVVTGRRGTSPGEVDALLALAVDAAAVTAGVLGGPLQASAQRAEAQARIRELVRARAFRPVFQPILDLTTSEVVGHEALTRFDEGLDPGEVFGTASRLGVGLELEQATLELALEHAGAQRDGHWLALNVTPSLLLRGSELDAILCDGHREGVVLEISEMEPVGDYAALLESIAGLTAAVQISVDDAGAGFASLSHVLALGARYVKLDKTWVHGIDADPAKRALVAGLQSFADETDAVLIAEGIETKGQLAEVRRLGIAYGQGWLLGMPQPL